MTAHRLLFPLVLAVLAGTGGLILRAQGNADAAKMKNPVAATPESIAAGQQLYARNCASCHGRNGQGGPGNDLIPAAPSLLGDGWTHGSTDGEIFTNIKNGVAPDFNMVPFKDRLKDDDIWNVVNYIRSIKK
jgi:mono/diheme cytochrome c family protein